MGIVRLVAIDVDGTLLDHRHQLSLRTRGTLTRLLAKDIHIVLATGKLFVGLRGIISELGLVAPQIASGGAVVAIPQTGEIVYRADIPRPLAAIALEVADEAGITVLVARDNQLFAEELNADTYYVVSHGNPTPTLVPNLLEVLDPAPTQLVAVSMRKSALAAFHEQFVRRGLTKQLTIYAGLPYVLDVLNSEVSKGHALEVVMDRLKVLPGDAVAVGDGENDISMFRIVGHSIAMGNANLAVKQAATEVTDSCDQDGLSNALEALGL